MKWGLQHVKVTLQEEDSGETVVIEQRSDGQIRCERGKPGKGSKPETKAAPAEARPETKAAPVEIRSAPEPARQAEKPKVAEKDATRAAARKTQSAPRQRKASSLEWKPTKDAGYEGFFARSEGGQFKVLRTRGSMWALFFERPGVKAEPLGCYLTLDKGKVRAQALHDKGMPAPEVEPITAAEIIHVCPAPAEDGEKPAKEPKTEPAAEAGASEASIDAELLGSLSSTIKQSIAGMDDDD